MDALIMFEACLRGQITHAARRPHDRERQDAIKSGNVFIYEEHASGIKRWTDGVSWSPSRILGNFLIYRELEKPFPPGEKKRALKKKKTSPGGIGKPDINSRLSISGHTSTATDSSVDKDTERALIGSLVDSYPFKTDGLIKKTISIQYNGIPHHLVSYYSVQDVVSGIMTTPLKHPELSTLVPRPELLMAQNFRAPVDQLQFSQDERGGPSPLFATLVNAHGHDFSDNSNSLLQRTMSTIPNYQPAPTSPAYSASPFAYHTQHHYMTSMNSSIPPPMPQQLSSSMPQPMNHSAPAVQSSISASMPPNTAHMPYTSQQQGNYSLQHHKAARFGTDAGFANEFPRNMPTQDPSRRNSGYQGSQPSDLSSISLNPTTDGRSTSNGHAYMRQASYYLQPQPTSMTSQDSHVFAQPRPLKTEPGLPTVEGGSQQYGLEESGQSWGYDELDNSQDQQYFGN
ncbi:Global transcription regulator sge1 [Conoideocrella luteorostrata]|uniref:Global transcription regulator sge1 n=1 Tax=Conoideocrella luteorostrata TaxID=1105319 RepID=A0AAJ0CKU3_9HYPO|nr:Global transcription regulator sge1 [Conoideocrella luteorostrata]